MSIIFDALKRAETQRNKGKPPTLGSAIDQQSTASDVQAGKRLWLLLAAFTLCGLGAWWFSAQPHDAPSAVAEKSPATEPAAPPAAAPEALREVASDAPTAIVQTDLTQAKPEKQLEAAAQQPSEQGGLEASGSLKNARVSMPELDRPMTGAVQFASSAPSPISAAELTPVDSAPAPEPAPAAQLTAEASVQPAASAAEVREPTAMQTPNATQASQAPQQLVAPLPGIPTVFELEYKIRYELPKMNVSMYVYNAQAAYRFVIIGGKRYREGEQVEAKVTLQQIRADGLECDYQGTRFFYPRQSL